MSDIKKIAVNNSEYYFKDELVRNSIGVASSETSLGIAPLDASGKVPSENLPSYVDDILEYDTKQLFPAQGESGKIYVDKSTDTTWRWSGTQYTQIKGDLTIGTTAGTAADGGIANTHYNNTNNPHNVTKEQVGLSNVGNFKAVSTEANQGLTDTEKTNARNNIGAGTSSFSGSYNDLTNKPVIPELSGGDDAARANWGGSWRMPTTAEFQALGSAVNTAWTQVNNVYGILCTDKTDSSKTLFFPAAGYCDNDSVRDVGNYGYYWSSSLDTSYRQNAYYLYFYSDRALWDYIYNRCYGFAVRPILDGANANGHNYVEIGGIKWATMNVGANSISEYGIYFQWGDTQGYTAAQVGSSAGQKYFGWEDYKYGNGTSSPNATDMTKYNATDGLTTLELSTPVEYLHKVAVTGDYNDLSNKPTIPAAVAVKGDAESEYRTGNVNITPANIGLGNVDNTADANKSVAYAANAKHIEPVATLPNNGVGMTVGEVKSWIANQLNSSGTESIGDYVFVSTAVVDRWEHESETVYESSVYAFIKIGGGYFDSTYGQYLISSFNLQAVGIVGRSYGQWSSIKWLATTDQIPTSLPANGGNADTVDGYHYNNLPYLPTSGGSITGNLNIQEGANLTLRASSSYPDGPGDLVFANNSNAEFMRIFYADNKAIIRFGANDSFKTILHSGNWSNYITIPTVYDWAKASTKPSYAASEVGISSSVQPITSNTSSSCSITGSSNDGKSQTIIYTNSTSSDLTVTVPTTYKTPDGAAIELTCKAGGYCEVSYLNIGGTIYARGL